MFAKLTKEVQFCGYRVEAVMIAVYKSSRKVAIHAQTKNANFCK